MKDESSNHIEEESEIDYKEKSKLEPSLSLKVFVAFVTLILGGSPFLKILRDTENIAIAIGGFCGALILPFVFVAFFQISKKFRNQKSRYRIYALTALVMLFIKLLAIFVKSEM